MKKTRLIRTKLELCCNSPSYMVYNDVDYDEQFEKFGDKDGAGRDFEEAVFKEKDLGKLSQKMTALSCKIMFFDEKIRELRAKQFELWEDFVSDKSVEDKEDTHYKDKIPVKKRLEHARKIFGK